MNQITIKKHTGYKDAQKIIDALSLAGGGTVYLEPEWWDGRSSGIKLEGEFEIIQSNSTGINLPANITLDGRLGWFHKLFKYLK